MNISAKFQLLAYSLLMASEELIFFFETLAFLLPWQPIKVSGLDIFYMFGRGLLKEHFCNSFVKISSVR